MARLREAFEARKKEVASRRVALRTKAAKRLPDPNDIKGRSCQFNMRLSEDELSTLEFFMAELSMSKSDVMRFLLHEARKEIQK